MALTFTDEQIANISLEQLSLPSKIKALEDTQENLEENKENLEKEDEQNGVFFNNFLGIIQQYHNELSSLNGVTKTTYNEQDLIDAGNQVPNSNHFPTNPTPYQNFEPKVLDSNNGNPTSFNSSNENDTITETNDRVNILKSGFSDGGNSDSLTEPYSPGSTKVNSGGFSVGQRVIVNQSNGGVFGTISSVTPAPPPGPTGPAPTFAEELSISEVDTENSSSLGIGSQIRNFHPGFNNAEREGLATPSDPAIRTIFQRRLDQIVDSWQGTLNIQETALQANDVAEDEEINQNAVAQNNIDDTQQELNDWENQPATGSGVGKYGDDGLTPLEAEISSRPSEVSTREIEIDDALGNVNQQSNGSFDGQGHYDSLFNWIDLRVNKVGGSLTRLNASTLGSEAIETQITQAETKVDEYQDTFTTKLLTESSNGTNIVKVQNTSRIKPGDEIKIIASDKPVLTVVVDAINARDELELNTSIPEGYSISGTARVVKQLQ